jgi:hypothetical protein
MKSLGLGRCALAIGAAAALLAGCGGSQPPIGAPGAMAQGNHVAGPASNEALLYASRNFNGVDVFAYPSLKPRGKLTGFEYVSRSYYFSPVGLCTDTKGNIFVAGYLYIDGGARSGQVYEFAHGGQTPIATLSEKYPGYGCAVDPSTGDLAETSPYSSVAGHGSVAIFTKGRGKPKYYVNSDTLQFTFCAYDDAGDLFIAENESTGIGELPKGAASFQQLQLSNEAAVTSVQWTGGMLAVSGSSGAKRNISNFIYQVEVTNGVAQIVGTTALQGLHGRRAFGQFWIDGEYVTEPAVRTDRGDVERLLMWGYPAGGSPIKKLKNRALWIGVTVSHAGS